MNCSCEDIRLIIQQELMNVIGSLEGKAAPRKKRKPSPYNLWIKECVPKKGGEIPERMRACALEYKKMSTEQKASLAERIAKGR